jgi:hypothetical protein
VPTDTNDANDVYLRDLLTSITSRVSVIGAGGQANGASANAGISSDGHHIAFESEASNLVTRHQHRHRRVPPNRLTDRHQPATHSPDQPR